MKPPRDCLLAPVALALSLSLSGCSSFHAPGWLWPFGDEAPEAAPARADAKAPAPPVPPPVPAAASLAPSDQAVLGFHERAEAFYLRLAQRRFNTLATYNDPMLRGYFETQEAYSDYYARLAQQLTEAHFEKNRPLIAEVQEFTLEGTTRARVRFRLVGKSGRPFRFWSTSVEGEDVWEQTGGRWWIVPGKL